MENTQIVNSSEITLLNCRLTSTSLEINESINLEEWESIGIKLKMMGRTLQFWIGDWIRFGQRQWGEMYTQAREITGLGYKTLKDFKYVAESVQLSLRSDNLSFNHHRIVAPLKPEDQELWLNRAEREGLTIIQLKQAIKGEDGQLDSIENRLSNDDYRCPNCARLEEENANLRERLNKYDMD